MRHAAQHARTRTRETRQRLAFEAARMMSEQGIRDFHLAKQRAAERLGVSDEGALPRNSEIEQALREYQRIFQADSQPQELLARREAALEAMAFFGRFEPRLVGAVLEGSADQHSAVCLHLFADDAEEVVHHLRDHGIPFDVSERHLRLDRDRSDSYPVLLFSADELPFDLTVLPRVALRQAPLDRVDQRPMQRASRGAVAALLESEAGRD